MIFATQDLTFTLGSLLLEGRAAFAARCVCARFCWPPAKCSAAG